MVNFDNKLKKTKKICNENNIVMDLFHELCLVTKYFNKKKYEIK